MSTVTTNGSAAKAARSIKPKLVPGPKVLAPTATAASISIQRVERRTALVPVIGTAPLIVHKWDAKAKQIMLDTQQGRKKQKTLRDPDADFRASIYRLPEGGHGFPALAFKAALVGGSRFYGKDVPMTLLRRAVYVEGHGPDMLVPLITEDEPIMREDMVRVGMGGTDLRYRAQYTEWQAVLTVRYTPSIIDLGSLLALIDAGGQGDGVGEWRPEKDGVYGTFMVNDDEDVVEVGT